MQLMQLTVVGFAIASGSAWCQAAYDEEDMREAIYEWLEDEAVCLPSWDMASSLTGMTVRWTVTQETSEDSAAASAITNTLYVGNQGEWRLSTDSLSGYLDYGRLGTTTWRMSEGWIVLLPSSAPSAPGHPVGQILQSVHHDLHHVLKVGVTECLRWRRGALRVDVHTTTWTWESPPDDRVRYEITGSWDPAIRRGFPSLIHRTDLNEVECEWRLKQWYFDTTYSNWVARSVVFRSNTGVRSWTLDRITELEEFDVFATPSFGGVDPIRGEITAISETDYREGPPVERLFVEGRVLEAPQAELEAWINEWRHGLRRGGQATTAFAVLAVVLVRLRQRLEPKLERRVSP